MGMLDDMLGSLSPEQQQQFMDKMTDMMQSGKSMQDVQNDCYTYQRVRLLEKYKALGGMFASFGGCCQAE